MSTGRVATFPRPRSLAVAAIAALAVAVLLTGVTRAAIFTFTADLTAEAEVPTPGPDGATGSAFITIDDETNEVCFELTIDGLAQDDAVIMAHIHEGAEGVAGDVVVPLFTEPPTGEMTGCVQDVDPSIVAAITGDPAGYYVNIHSEQFPDGAVRGQLVVASVGGGCSITVEPSTIAEGGQFTVTGDFGGAEIHVIRGEDATVPEDAEPLVMTPADQASFSATITMESDSAGTWTVWAFIEGSECGDSAILTVTEATVPNTAVPADGVPTTGLLGMLLLMLGTLGILRVQRASSR
jgi:CHRD domain